MEISVSWPPTGVLCSTTIYTRAVYISVVDFLYIIRQTTYIMFMSVYYTYCNNMMFIHTCMCVYKQCANVYRYMYV